MKCSATFILTFHPLEFRSSLGFLPGDENRRFPLPLILASSWNIDFPCFITFLIFGQMLLPVAESWHHLGQGNHLLCWHKSFEGAEIFSDSLDGFAVRLWRCGNRHFSPCRHKAVERQFKAGRGAQNPRFRSDLRMVGRSDQSRASHPARPVRTMVAKTRSAARRCMAA